jgi:DNA invertase Pin-like site-specific DNA recombinase
MLIDVSTTVRALAELGARVYCLAHGGADLTSSAGTMTMNVLNAVAQFERDLLIERTQSGPKRAKSEGKALGRPSTLSVALLLKGLILNFCDSVAAFSPSSVLGRRGRTLLASAS